MSERYRFEHRGAPLVADIDVVDIPTTSDAPNLRVIEGSWPTWRLEITRPEGAPAEARMLRCVDPGDHGAPHPHGNLTAEQSASITDVVVIRRDGYLARIPDGEIVLGPWRDQAYRDDLDARINDPRRLDRDGTTA